MDFTKTSTSGLLKLHGAVQDALAVDDNLPDGAPKVYGVRDFSDWKIWSGSIEVELDRRGVQYQKIPW
ncbi:MAG: hypothetical protein ABGZ35_05315 [Planctomycetaceae bacterium]